MNSTTNRRNLDDPWTMASDIYQVPPDDQCFLHRLPLETFIKICNFVEPVWLSNLAFTCHAMNVRLSVNSANGLWYSVMPSNIWTARECHQDEAEIFSLWVNRNLAGLSFVPDFPDMSIQQLVPTPFNVPSDHTCFLSLSGTGIRNAFSRNSSRRIMLATDGNIFDPRNGAYSLPHGHDILYDSASRRQVGALGVGYNPMINYRREITGRIVDGRHCYICLSPTKFDGQFIGTWCWNMLFCPVCHDNYTISQADMKELNVIDMNTIDEEVTFKPHVTAYVSRYFRPEIDQIVRQCTGLDSKAVALSNAKSRYAREMHRLGESGLEAFRRSARVAIVKAAQMIWEGVDPAPELSYHEPSKTLSSRRRSHMPTERVFRFWRERFAPTSKLPDFLFPAYKLASVPTSVPFNQDKEWIEDPTLGLISIRTNSSFEKRWVSRKALKMLQALVGWADPSYNCSGHGGCVTNWVEAAKEYHLGRCESSLMTADTLLISGFAINRWLNPMYFHELRIYCGFQALPPIPSRPARDAYLEPISSADYIPLDEYIRRNADAERVEKQHAYVMETMKRFIRDTYRKRPRNPRHSVLVGLEGFVELFRLEEPAHFWMSDEWTSFE